LGSAINNSYHHDATLDLTAGGNMLVGTIGIGHQ
jgi:hypothetical protein